MTTTTPSSATLKIRPAQPLPVLAFVTRLGDHSAVTRQWPGDAHLACRLCDECDAVPCRGGGAVCTVLVDQPVADGDAAAYASCGFGSDGLEGAPRRPRAGLFGS